jgi:putative DNA primase/helicase
MSRNPPNYPSARDLARALGCTRRPDANGNYSCRCPGPSHRRGDRSPSLSVKDGSGRPIFKCHAGCDWRDVIAALIRMCVWPAFRVGGGA